MDDRGAELGPLEATLFLGANTCSNVSVAEERGLDEPAGPYRT
jgi:hypothetical protein